MEIRLLSLFRISYFISITVVVLILLCNVPGSVSYPAERRTWSLVDRLIRANPFRHLANFVGQKLSLDLPRGQESQPVFPMVTLPQIPGQMQATHYVKIPTWHQVYYTPPPAPVAMMAPVYQPYPQKYLLHGYSQPVPLLPEQQPPPQQQQMQITRPPALVQPVQAVSTYAQPALVTESTVNSAIQFEPTSFTSNINNHILQEMQQPQPENAPVAMPPPSSSPVQLQVQTEPSPEYYLTQQQQPKTSSSLEKLNQVESPPPPFLLSEYVDANHETGSSILDSANQLNEMDIATDNINPLREQLPAPPSSSSENQSKMEDTTNSANSMRIILIQPTDMENTKSTKEEAETEAAEVSNFMRGYTMKFIDLDEGAQEMVVTSQRSTNSRPEVEKKSCVDPFCDNFLRKLIPELLQITRSNQKDDEPIVIIKNNEDNKKLQYNQLTSTTPSSTYSSYLEDHQIMNDYGHSNNHQVSVVKAVEESEVHDLYQDQAQSPTLKPQRLHYPRKLISSKINSTFYDNFKPKLRSSIAASLQTSVTKRDKTQTERNRNLLEKLQNYRVSSMVSPSYRRSISYTSSDQNSEDPAQGTETPLHSLIPRPRSYQTLKVYNPIYSRVRRGKRKQRLAKRDQDGSGNLEKIKDRADRSSSPLSGVIFNKTDKNDS